MPYSCFKDIATLWQCPWNNSLKLTQKPWSWFMNFCAARIHWSKTCQKIISTLAVFLQTSVDGWWKQFFTLAIIWKSHRKPENIYNGEISRIIVEHFSLPSFCVVGFDLWWLTKKRSKCWPTFAPASQRYLCMQVRGRSCVTTLPLMSVKIFMKVPGSKWVANGIWLPRFIFLKGMTVWHAGFSWDIPWSLQRWDFVY